MTDKKITVVQHIYDKLVASGETSSTAAEGIQYFLHHFGHMDPEPTVYNVVKTLDEVYLDWVLDTPENWDKLLNKCSQMISDARFQRLAQDIMDSIEDAIKKNLEDD